jgi:hypothetical protein
MSTKITVTESAIRQLINNLLEGRDTPAVVAEPPTIPVNPALDPMVRMTGMAKEPINPMFSPTDKIEFQASVKNLVHNLPDEDLPDLFYAIKDAINAEEDKKDKEKQEENGDSMTLKDSRMESLRLGIRKVIQEARPEHHMDPSDIDADEEAEELAAQKKYEMTADVGGSTFDEIAIAMGFANPIGAKGAVDKALKKMKFLMTLPEEERNELVLSAMDKYIKVLQKKGSLKADDVQLLKDHPEIVQELDGFREFMRNHIHKGMRDAGGHDEDLDEDDHGDMVGKSISFGGGKAKVQDPKAAAGDELQKQNKKLSNIKLVGEGPEQQRAHKYAPDADCLSCNGTGTSADPAQDGPDCWDCAGSGRMSSDGTSDNDMTSCPMCHGMPGPRGCKTCDGTGQVRGSDIPDHDELTAPTGYSKPTTPTTELGESTMYSDEASDGGDLAMGSTVGATCKNCQKGTYEKQGRDELRCDYCDYQTWDADIRRAEELARKAAKLSKKNKKFGFKK